MSDASCLKTLLPIYYRKYFPLKDLIRWLCYGERDKFYRREFSFVLRNDVYIRYQSFQVEKQMEIELQRMSPSKIDIGAIYNMSPKKGAGMCPVERELVFDIDISDYDSVRNCCKKTDICIKCWKYIAIAVKILDSTLREDFGFKHILWVFSGRRGVHCWVCDKSARILSAQARKSIVKYLTLLSGTPDTKKRINLPKNYIHPFINRALKIIKSSFFTLCVLRQNMLGTKKGIEHFVNMMPNKQVQTEVTAFLEKYPTSTERWEKFLTFYENDMIYNSDRWPKGVRFLDEVALEYCCLRLDYQVTMDNKHLLKSPYCVHPANGKICIPLDPKEIDSFDPNFTPPRIDRLCNTNESTQQFDNKSFQKSLEVFSRFHRKLERYNYE